MKALLNATASLLLIALAAAFTGLWIRSRQTADVFNGFDKTGRLYYLESSSGEVKAATITNTNFFNGAEWTYISKPISRFVRSNSAAPAPFWSRIGFGFTNERNLKAIHVPDWFLIALLLVFPALWCRRLYAAWKSRRQARCSGFPVLTQSLVQEEESKSMNRKATKFIDAPHARKGEEDADGTQTDQ